MSLISLSGKNPIRTHCLPVISHYGLCYLVIPTVKIMSFILGSATFTWDSALMRKKNRCLGENGKWIVPCPLLDSRLPSQASFSFNPPSHLAD